MPFTVYDTNSKIKILATPGGVTSAVAGTGIAVSSSIGAVTITNSGVTSAIATAGKTTVSGATGAVTIGLGTDVPLLDANNHFTGTGDQVFDGNMKPATMQMFSWTSKTIATVYQAASDGLVVVYYTQDSSNYGIVDGLSDSSNPPTTQRCRGGQIGSGSNSFPAFGSFTMPVKKGDFYKVYLQTVSAGAGPTVTINWVPLGTAG